MVPRYDQGAREAVECYIYVCVCVFLLYIVYIYICINASIISRMFIYIYTIYTTIPWSLQAALDAFCEFGEAF